MFPGLALASFLAASAQATAGDIEARGATILYDCEAKIVEETKAGVSRVVTNFENAKAFQLDNFDDTSGSVLLRDPFVYATPVPGRVRIEGKLRVLAFGLKENATGREMAVDLILNFENPDSAAFLQHIETSEAPGKPARDLIRAGLCTAKVKFGQ
jgi:hypothetical protein